MTAERDRLAALLRDAQPTEWDFVAMSDSYALAYADRLIAAGVSLIDGERLAEMALIDVERLARALRAESALLRKAANDPEVTSIVAAAIAAAYREDATEHREGQEWTTQNWPLK